MLPTGQFWNVPVSLAPFNGRNIFGETLANAYVANVMTRSGLRSYVGMLYRMTWEREEGPCLYVGDSQSFSIYEIEDPNDPDSTPIKSCPKASWRISSSDSWRRRDAAEDNDIYQARLCSAALKL